MPTIALRVQQNGTLQGWDSVIGATFAYQAIDDSDGVTHDSDDTCIVLGRLGSPPAGQVSFPVFLQAAGITPSGITVNVAARRTAAAHPRLHIGFYRAGATGFHGSLFDPGATYSVASRTFTTDPITGAAWTEEALVGLEVCVQSEEFTLGSNRISLISGSVDDYTRRTNTMRRIPAVAVTA